MAPLLQEASECSRLTYQDVAAVVVPPANTSSSNNSRMKETATATAAQSHAAGAPPAAAAAADVGVCSPHAALERLLQLQPESPPDDVQKLSLAKRGAAGFYSGGAGSMLYAGYKVVQSK
jgi:hypothetical protein